MNTAELVRRMSAVGAPPEAITIALEAIAAAHDEQLERRKRNAERMRQKRARTCARTVRAQGGKATSTSAETPPEPATASKNGNGASKQPTFPTLITSSLSSSEKPTESQQRKEEQVEGRSTTKKRRPRYSDEFERFWRLYPTTKTMSKKTAGDQFEKLTPEDQQAAIAAIGPYKAELAKNTWQSAVHACRFLQQRRFDTLIDASKALPQKSPPAGLPEPLIEFWMAGWRKGMAFSPPMKTKCPALEVEYGYRGENTGANASKGAAVLHSGSVVHFAPPRPPDRAQAK